MREELKMKLTSIHNRGDIVIFKVNNSICMLYQGTEGEGVLF